MRLFILYLNTQRCKTFFRSYSIFIITLYSLSFVKMVQGLLFNIFACLFLCQYGKEDKGHVIVFLTCRSGLITVFFSFKLAYRQGPEINNLWNIQIKNKRKIPSEYANTQFAPFQIKEGWLNTCSLLVHCLITSLCAVSPFLYHACWESVAGLNSTWPTQNWSVTRNVFPVITKNVTNTFF